MDFVSILLVTAAIVIGIPILIGIYSAVAATRQTSQSKANAAAQADLHKQYLADAAEKFSSIIADHIDTLGREYATRIRRDRYGVEDRSDWIKERDYFISKVLSPKSGYGAPAAIDKAKEMVDKAASQQAALIEDIRLSEDMTPIDFERWCAQELGKVGWTVTTTKATGDQGADVVAEFEGFRLILQCKLYSSPVGNGAVQEAFSAKRHYFARASAVVTNSSFTPSARDLAASTGVLLIHHSQLKTINKLLGRSDSSSQSPPSEQIVSLSGKNSAVISTVLDDLDARINAAKSRLKSTV